MHFLVRAWLLFFGLLLLCLTSCSHDQAIKKKRQKRPVAGDKVTPVLLLGKTWRQNGPVLLSTRLQVERKGIAAAELLQLEDVPYEIVPTVTIQFFADEKCLKETNDVSLARDC